MVFLKFCLFRFAKFQMIIVKYPIMGFEGYDEVLLCQKYLYLHIFDNETTALLKFF